MVMAIVTATTKKSTMGMSMMAVLVLHIINNINNINNNNNNDLRRCNVQLAYRGMVKPIHPLQKRVLKYFQRHYRRRHAMTTMLEQQQQQQQQ